MTTIDTATGRYRIAEIAELSGFSPSTLRYYEQAGVLSAGVGPRRVRTGQAPPPLTISGPPLPPSQSGLSTDRAMTPVAAPPP